MRKDFFREWNFIPKIVVWFYCTMQTWKCWKGNGYRMIEREKECFYSCTNMYLRTYSFGYLSLIHIYKLFFKREPSTKMREENPAWCKVVLRPILFFLRCKCHVKSYESLQRYAAHLEGGSYTLFQLKKKYESGSLFTNSLFAIWLGEIESCDTCRLQSPLMIHVQEAFIVCTL